MNHQQEKLDLQTRLANEGWTFLTNYPNNTYLADLNRNLGAENVCLQKAYDISGNHLPDTHAVYARKTAIEQTKEREKQMLELTYKPIDEADKKSHIFRMIANQTIRAKKGDESK